MQLSPTVSLAYIGKLLGHTTCDNLSVDSLHALYCYLTSNYSIKSCISTQQVPESMQDELLQLNINTFQHDNEYYDAENIIHWG
jgi:hypothetical protein